MSTMRSSYIFNSSISANLIILPSSIAYPVAKISALPTDLTGLFDLDDPQCNKCIMEFSDIAQISKPIMKPNCLFSDDLLASENTTIDK